MILSPLQNLNKILRLFSGHCYSLTGFLLGQPIQLPRPDWTSEALGSLDDRPAIPTAVTSQPTVNSILLLSSNVSLLLSIMTTVMSAPPQPVTTYLVFHRLHSMAPGPCGLSAAVADFSAVHLTVSSAVGAKQGVDNGG